MPDEPVRLCDDEGRWVECYIDDVHKAIVVIDDSYQKVSISFDCWNELTQRIRHESGKLHPTGFIVDGL